MENFYTRNYPIKQNHINFENLVGNGVASFWYYMYWGSWLGSPVKREWGLNTYMYMYKPHIKNERLVHHRLHT